MTPNVPEVPEDIKKIDQAMASTALAQDSPKTFTESYVKGLEADLEKLTKEKELLRQTIQLQQENMAQMKRHMDFLEDLTKKHAVAGGSVPESDIELDQHFSIGDKVAFVNHVGGIENAKIKAISGNKAILKVQGAHPNDKRTEVDIRHDRMKGKNTFHALPMVPKVAKTVEEEEDDD